MIGNRGGNTLSSYDLFRHFFPGIAPFGASRLRGNAASQIFMEAFGDTHNSTIESFFSDWNFRNSLTTNLERFGSWNGTDGFYPAASVNGDNFTSLSRRDLNNSQDDCFSDRFIPFGFGNNSGTTSQPFKTSNIIVLTDGVCASSCSLFTEVMTRQARVKTVVVGRPRRQPSQAIDGTKARCGSFFIGKVQSTSKLLKANNVVPTDQLALADSTFPGLKSLPFVSDLSKFNINLRDNIPEGDDQQVPLQFIFEPADCRIFYTAQSVTQPREVWKQVADVMWGNQDLRLGKLERRGAGAALSPPSGAMSGTSPGSSALGTGVSMTASATQNSVVTASVAAASGTSSATPAPSNSESSSSAVTVASALRVVLTGFALSAVIQLTATVF
ncbi:MAG: hypothetical protein M1820_004349 [Bogoriella megaspora]|nr:MAG: hypothetical protein M1820_004349 [Bogoriella megaspora]